MTPEVPPQRPAEDIGLEFEKNPVNPDEAKDALEGMDIVDINTDEGSQTVDCSFKMINESSSDAKRAIKAAKEAFGELDHNSPEQYVDPDTGYAYAIIVDSSGKKPKYHIAKTTEVVFGGAGEAPEGYKELPKPKGRDKQALKYAKTNIGGDDEFTVEDGNTTYIYTKDGKFYKSE